MPSRRPEIPGGTIREVLVKVLSLLGPENRVRNYFLLENFRDLATGKEKRGLVIITTRKLEPGDTVYFRYRWRKFGGFLRARGPFYLGRR
jgi:hypothetical protein